MLVSREADTTSTCMSSSNDISKRLGVSWAVILMGAKKRKSIIETLQTLHDPIIVIKQDLKLLTIPKTSILRRNEFIML